MGKITRLQLENFTCFAKLDVEFSNGVNILIGENGTGKTHILKVLYAACAITVGEGKERDYFDKLVGVFKPYRGDFMRLLRNLFGANELNQMKIQNFPNNLANMAVSSGDVRLECGFSLGVLEPPKQELNDSEWRGCSLDGVYIPVKEMLVHAPGFISLTARREIAFEEVYIDIIKQAYLPKLRTLPNEKYKNIYTKLSEVLGGTIVLKGEIFFLKTQKGEIEFSLLAEGLRKIALLWLLIQNGSLNPGTILFWDEPESNLNPALLGVVVETLLELQRQGVQIFLTTHNYVLLKEFDLRKKADDAVRYISLYRNETDSVVAKSSDTYVSISPNAISDTFSDLYQRDIARVLRRG
jgi:hypothetical protein